MASKPKKQNTKKNTKRTISAAEVRRLGFEYENIVQADETLRTSKSLAELIANNKKLQSAWQRGQFLRNLKLLAGEVNTVSEAAKELKLESGEILRDLIDNDREVREIWIQTRFDTKRKVRSGIITAAESGNQAAIKAAESFLKDEKPQNAVSFDLIRLRQVDLCNLLGTTRPSINEWENKYGMPRNSDKTYSLKDVLAWYIEYMKVKNDTGSGKLSNDKLRDLKAKQMELDLSEREGELLERKEVIAGFIARWQNIVNAFNIKKREVAIMLHGQTIDGIEDILSRFFADIQNEQLNIPDFLKLPKEAEAKLLELMELFTTKDTKEHEEN